MAVMYRDPTVEPPQAYDVVRVDDPAVAGDHAAVERHAVPATQALTDDCWTRVPAIAWGPPASRTTFRAAWHDAALLVRFDAVDAHPWYTLTERDAHIWNEEVVELFLDVDGTGQRYAEFEVNPAGTICDLIVASGWPSLQSDPAWHCDGTTARVAMRCDDAGRASGWTADLVIPWAGLAALGDHAASRVPPAPGDRWRFNVFRIDRPHGPADPERDAIYAAWSVPSGPSFHDTHAFRDLRFR